jgi:chemotaxis family two-component system sensor kinase Cph1
MPNSRRPTNAHGKRVSATRTGAKGAVSNRIVNAQALLHELRVHQIELEAQNEELRHARAEMELAVQRYTELFDFAPVGYVIVAADSTITEVNHTGAQLLGLVRANLRGVRFDRLVPSAHRGAFAQGFTAARASGEKQIVVLELLRFSGEAFAARVSLISLLRTDPVILVAMEDLDSK